MLDNPIGINDKETPVEKEKAECIIIKKPSTQKHFPFFPVKILHWIADLE